MAIDMLVCRSVLIRVHVRVETNWAHAMVPAAMVEALYCPRTVLWLKWQTAAACASHDIPHHLARAPDDIGPLASISGDLLLASLNWRRLAHPSHSLRPTKLGELREIVICAMSSSG